MDGLSGTKAKVGANLGCCFWSCSCSVGADLGSSAFEWFLAPVWARSAAIEDSSHTGAAAHTPTASQHHIPSACSVGTGSMLRGPVPLPLVTGPLRSVSPTPQPDPSRHRGVGIRFFCKPTTALCTLKLRCRRRALIAAFMPTRPGVPGPTVRLVCLETHVSIESSLSLPIILHAFDM